MENAWAANRAGLTVSGCASVQYDRLAVFRREAFLQCVEVVARAPVSLRIPLSRRQRKRRGNARHSVFN
jgi:phage portal protein BeeE